MKLMAEKRGENRKFYVISLGLLGEVLSEAGVTRITEAFSLSKPVKALTAEIKFYFEAFEVFT